MGIDLIMEIYKGFYLKSPHQHTAWKAYTYVPNILCRSFLMVHLELSVAGGLYLLDDGDGICGQTAWILHIIIHYAVKHLLLILTRERRLKQRVRKTQC